MTGWMAVFLTYWRVPLARLGAVLAAAGIALGYGGAALLWAPAAAREEAILADLNRLARQRAILGERRDLAERYVTLSARADLLDERLAADVDRSDLVRAFSELSAQAGTRIIHGANRFGTERAGVVPVLQDLTVEGSYEQVREFLAAVDRLETLTMLASLDLQANADGTLVRGTMLFVTLTGGAS